MEDLNARLLSFIQVRESHTAVVLDKRVSREIFFLFLRKNICCWSY